MGNGNVNFSTVPADGIEVFYRSSGSPSNPTILLLHGFPSSSFHFRNLIPLLSKKYHVIAPDLPGFGFTSIPDSRNYKYTFENITLTIEAFISALSIKTYSVYVFDYGAPVAFRLALRNLSHVSAIITQNGNAYEEGLGHDFWSELQVYWKSDSNEDRLALVHNLTFEATKWQYEFGTPSQNLSKIPPESYHLDYALLARPGQQDIQLDLFRDYEKNVELYPAFQRYFRESQVPLLVVWGEHDVLFLKKGAEAYKRDLPNAELHFLDAGHMAVQTNGEEIAELMLEFLDRQEL